MILAVAMVPWAAVTGQAGFGDPPMEPSSPLSLEGIWTTMVPTPSGHASINSFVIDAQGSEGMVYTCVGKHPQCSPTGLGMFPETQRLSDMLGYCVRTGANTFRISVIYHGVKDGGPERMGVGEILYMTVLAGTAELADPDTLVVADGTLAAYAPDQDADGDRLPDEGAVPMGLPDEGAVPMACFAVPVTFTRLPMFGSCEPTPPPFEMP
jgi:hypothetical protein